MKCNKTNLHVTNPIYEKIQVTPDCTYGATGGGVCGATGGGGLTASSHDCPNFKQVFSESPYLLQKFSRDSPNFPTNFHWSKREPTPNAIGSIVTCMYRCMYQRVAKTCRIPYLYRSFSAKKPYNSWLFSKKWPATYCVTYGSLPPCSSRRYIHV